MRGLTHSSLNWLKSAGTKIPMSVQPSELSSRSCTRWLAGSECMELMNFLLKDIFLILSWLAEIIAQPVLDRSQNLVDSMINRLESYANNLEEVVAERTKQLEEEKKRTDALLYRMLPRWVAHDSVSHSDKKKNWKSHFKTKREPWIQFFSLNLCVLFVCWEIDRSIYMFFPAFLFLRSVADELKQGRLVPAEWFDGVTVYFSDIVSFTTLAAESSPMQIVALLNELYTLFDDVITHHDVYKVQKLQPNAQIMWPVRCECFSPNGILVISHVELSALSFWFWIFPDDRNWGYSRV